ncbi:glycerol-3-phosphate dehydrogenase [Lentzea albidocapillata subsp. violacea]|uniref:Glycerol-3-phosphate dehydrogenase n=1 Tax=Lentzea albidocapillata subsp. violacea TaxID=128104 RepID=A0A1G9GVL4_9PSEU|nr:glycerol-3-phosphate dehydrogenase/oxidase [Lentzea albidocapillata]SDL04595.1 glycerol-3-phosphate dehydrogenase [Lentzea albidocapillata subsp. violacea]
MNTSLNAARRLQDLEAAQREVADLLVIGGGVTGAGVALDAASRGLRTVLLEAHDLAFGTSRWSSKLVHGGLRYLAKGDVRLAHESAVERGILMTRTAPHLTRTLPMLFPLHAGAGHFVMSGFRAGNALRIAARTPSDVLPRPRRVQRHEAMALVPGLDPAKLTGGLLSYDGQLVDDARLVVALARTAAGQGARIITRAKVVTLQGDGAEAVDTLTGTTFTVQARAVVNATGVWAGTLAPVHLRPSRGSHLVIDARSAGLTGTALTIPVPGERNRYALLLPQANGRAYLGLTDEPVDDIPDVPQVPESDVDFLLTTASHVLQRDLTRDDVIGSYAGLRPLIEAEGRTADLSRNHAVLRAPNGVITVVGGKLTTYRRMAADAVDATNLTRIPCRTKDIRLVDDRPTPTTPIAPGVTEADVVHAIRHEGALDADDVLDRRTRIGLVPKDREKAAPEIEKLLTNA